MTTWIVIIGAAWVASVAFGAGSKSKTNDNWAGVPSREVKEWR